MVKNVRTLSEYRELLSTTDNESQELFKLRRRLEANGISPASDDAMDMAIVSDNEALIRGYIDRETSHDTHTAVRLPKKRREGKLTARALEAEQLRELGLSTTDAKTLSRYLVTIAQNKKSIAKAKTKRRINNKRRQLDIYQNDLEAQLLELEREAHSHGIFDPVDVDRYVEDAFA